MTRFIIEVIDQLNLTKLTSRYSGKGSQAYHPAMMLALLVYGYATGTFSSRKIERATHDSVAFVFLRPISTRITTRSQISAKPFCWNCRNCLCKCWP